MSSPDASPNPVDDIAVRGWHGITVRVAWTLLAHSVKVRPGVLRDAREHGLIHLDPHASLAVAEDAASHYTAQFVTRTRGGWTSEIWEQDPTMPFWPRWRKAVEDVADPLVALVFRSHFGDGRPLDWLEARSGLDVVALERARDVLRAVVRAQAGLNGVPVADWSVERLDCTIARLAQWSPGPCPPLAALLAGEHKEHARGCVRCERTVRLERGEVLKPEDMIPPTVGARPGVYPLGPGSRSVTR